MAGESNAAAFTAEGQIVANTGDMDTQGQAMVKIYQKLNQLSEDINSDLEACSGWEGADKEAFKELVIRFQTYFDDIGKTLRKFGWQTQQSATDYARMQQTNVDQFNQIGYTTVDTAGDDYNN